MVRKPNRLLQQVCIFQPGLNESLPDSYRDSVMWASKLEIWRYPEAVRPFQAIQWFVSVLFPKLLWKAMIAPCVWLQQLGIGDTVLSFSSFSNRRSDSGAKPEILCRAATLFVFKRTNRRCNEKGTSRTCTRSAKIIPLWQTVQVDSVVSRL